jgi:hypothetical protein
MTSRETEEEADARRKRQAGYVPSETDREPHTGVQRFEPCHTSEAADQADGERRASMCPFSPTVRHLPATLQTRCRSCRSRSATTHSAQIPLIDSSARQDTRRVCQRSNVLHERITFCCSCPDWSPHFASDCECQIALTSVLKGGNARRGDV